MRAQTAKEATINKLHIRCVLVLLGAEDERTVPVRACIVQTKRRKETDDYVHVKEQVTSGQDFRFEFLLDHRKKSPPPSSIIPDKSIRWFIPCRKQNESFAIEIQRVYRDLAGRGTALSVPGRVKSKRIRQRQRFLFF